MADCPLNPHIRFIDNFEYWNELKLRYSYSGSRFLDISRIIDDSSTAFSLSNSTESISSDEHTLRSILTGRSSVYGKKCEPWNIFEFEIGSSKVKANSMFSKTFGNQLVYRIGKYGKTKKSDILSIINYITDGCRDKESLLAKWFLNLTHSKLKPIACDLININANLRKLPKKELETLFDKTLSIYYLIFILEVTRRPKHNLSIGYKKTKDSKYKPTILSQEFCLISTIQALKLIESKSLTMQNVFDRDAQYGLPTGCNLRYENESIFKEKILKINNMYMKTFYKNEYDIAINNDKTLMLSCEGIHKLLTQATTLKTETPSKSYLTPSKKRPYTDDTDYTNITKVLNFGHINKKAKR